MFSSRDRERERERERERDLVVIMGRLLSVVVLEQKHSLDGYIYPLMVIEDEKHRCKDAQQAQLPNSIGFLCHNLGIIYLILLTHFSRFSI